MLECFVLANYLVHYIGLFGIIFLVVIVFFICCWINRNKILVVNGKWIDACKEKNNVQFFIILFVLFFAFVMVLLKLGNGMLWEKGACLLIVLFMFSTFIYKICADQMKINCQKQYADKYEAVITELRERQHKFMNQLNSVYALCKIYDSYDELVQHQVAELNHLKKYLMPGELLILERPLVVAHIYTKLCEAEEKQIYIHTDFSCSLEYIDVPDIFLIEIIGNLLDNAMDEVAIRNKNERIRMEIIGHGNGICISVGNEHDKIPYKEYSQFFKEKYSVKGDRRGVGLPYVKKIVDKFHGYIEIGNVMYGTDNYFIISIYLKDKKRNLLPS